MKQYLKRFIEPASGRDIPLNDRLSARMILVRALASFFGMFVCIFANTHILAVIITAFFSVGIPVVYAILVSKGKVKLLNNVMMVSLFILAGISVFWGFFYGFGAPFNFVGGSTADSGELLNDETLGKIEALEDVIDTYYYKT